MAQNTGLVAGLFNVVNAEELNVTGIRRGGRGGNSPYAEAIRALAALESGQALQMTVFGNKAKTNTRANMIAANNAARRKGEGITLITRSRETGNTLDNVEGGEPEYELYFIKGADADDAE
jgi:hypothetical protein